MPLHDIRHSAAPVILAFSIQMDSIESIRGMSGLGREKTGGVSIAGTDLGDRAYTIVTTAFAACIPLLLIAIAVEIGRAAWPALHQFGFGFLTSSEWDVPAGKYGAAPAIFGTIVSSFIALLIATPLALGVAIFLSEFAPRWLQQPVAFLVD